MKLILTSQIQASASHYEGDSEFERMVNEAAAQGEIDGLGTAQAKASSSVSAGGGPSVSQVGRKDESEGGVHWKFDICLTFVQKGFPLLWYPAADDRRRSLLDMLV